jgi:pimeloyl-ACP methyl ester carboxylesterase
MKLLSIELLLSQWLTWPVLCMAWTTATTSPSPPTNVKLLVLPGFGNDPIDYELPQAPEGSLIRSLQGRGWSEDQIRTLPMQRSDWLQVFWRGFFDVQFWAGTAPPTRPAFSWYLDRIQSTVDEMCTSDDAMVVLVAHSAGGWLARAALGTAQQDDTTGSQFRKKIAGVVTLGSPHVSPPKDLMDMTRGALKWTDETFPGAFYRDDLFYLTVAGNAIAGVEQKRQSPLEPQTATGFAFESYKTVCGDGSTTGDGVVPVCAAHLDDATQLVLDGVFHSINAPASWYGSDAKIDLWHDVMLQQLSQRTKEKSFKESPFLFGMLGK